MKKIETTAVSEKVLYLKIVRIMKLTIALLLFACLQVSAKGWSQERITLKMTAAEIKKVLFAIEKRSDYRFLFSEEAIKGKPRVTVDVVDAPLSDVLDRILANTGVSYKILGSNLVVLKEAISSSEIAVVDIRITGKVTAESGEPLGGVSVSVKGTRSGTTTDAAGNYAITVPDNGVLVFSSVGYETVEVSVAGKTTVDVSLRLSTRSIEEVVVIGYGTAAKRDLTGSIVKISGKEVADKPNTNPIASLQGKVAGLSVVNNGTPGAAPDIRIRGTVSIGQVHPLYVVDGILNDNIDYLNPNDIESIEILKDPSSLAIFGIRGATGVIAITTKRAKAGEITVNFNSSYGFKKLVDKIDLADANEFATLFAEERANDGTTAPFDYTGLTANTDWIDAVTRTGKFLSNNITISGSTEKNRFTLGMGYLSDEGIIRHEKLAKWLLSFNDELKLTKTIKVGVNLNVSRQNNPYNATWVLDAARKVIPQVSSGTKQFYVRNPYGAESDSMYVDIYSGLDVGLQSSGVVNPLVEVENEWDKGKNIEYRSVGSIYGEVSFLKNFSVRSTIYADISNVNNRRYKPIYYAYNPKDNTPYLSSPTTRVSENDDSYKKFQQDHVLTYKKNFSGHGVTATAGFTTYYSGVFRRAGNTSQFTGPTGIPIPDDERFWYITNGFEDPSATAHTSYQSEYSTVSWLARGLYNYRNKYFLNASFRDDASSRIPKENRHQQFWAIGAAWEITREDFMKDVKFFDFLKLKGSIGVLGNQTASRENGDVLDYPFYPNLITGSAAVFGTNVYSAARTDYIPNPDLRWETVSAQEIGVELNAFQNRLHFEANYFNKTTKDLMTYVNRELLGLKNKLINGGELRNWGEEFTADWTQNFSNDLTLKVGGNITFLKNKVLSLSEELPTGVLSRRFQNNGSAESRTLPGQPIGVFYGYIVEGIFQSYAEILASPVASSIGAYRPGDFKFKDINGPDGKGPDGKITADDRTVIGNPTPDFIYGGTIELAYKGLTLAMDMGGVYGNQIFRTWGSLESPFQRVNYSGDKRDRWHGPGTSNWVPLVSQGDRYNYNGSTYNIEDGSYFRIRNIQLAYNFANRLISKWRMKNLRLYANVQNLKTWKNNLGYTSEYGGDATAFGYDNAGGAIPMVTTFGLNVTF